MADLERLKISLLMVDRGDMEQISRLCEDTSSHFRAWKAQVMGMASDRTRVGLAKVKEDGQRLDPR